MIDFGVGVLCLDFSDGERTVSPEEVMKDVCDLDAHFGCDFWENVVVAV